MDRLTLLHTNDLHGHLGPSAALALAQLKAQFAPCLLLDSGDAVTCGNVGWHRAGEPMHQRMAAAGFDALALGNREFHFRPGPQRCKLRLAPAPMLCANLRPVGWCGLRPTLTVTPPLGPPIFLFGLLVPMVTEAMFARHLSPARFDEPVAAARAALATRPVGSIAVALTHLGLARDRELAAACPELAAILGGHSHTPTVERAGQTVITQNQAHGASVTRLTLNLDGAALAEIAVEQVALPEDSRT